MTPIASQEPSRIVTPVRATTTTRSPASSRSSTPGAAPASSTFCPSSDNLDTCTNELSDQELQMKTRREIMALGTKLGMMNIAVWASNDGEDRNASNLLKTDTQDQPNTTVTEARAAAWEDAEKVKYLASKSEPLLFACFYAWCNCFPPPSTARSVTMRDMGTEMNPIASQEPSRTVTPVRGTTPTRSPTSSRPSTPGAAPASSPFRPSNDNLDTNTNELSDQELKMKTRR